MFDALAKYALGQAGLLIGARIGGAICTLLFSIIVTRTLPVAEAGLVLTWISAAMIATVFVSLNMEAGSVRYLNDAGGEAKGFLRFVNGFTAVWGAVFALLIVLVYRAVDHRDWIGVALFCAAMPFFGLLRVNRLSGTAMGRAAQATIPNQLLRPAALLLIGAVAWLIGAPLGFTGLAAAFLATTAFTYLVQVILVAPAFSGLQGPVRLADWQKWLVTGLSFAPALLLTEHYPLFLTIVGSPAVEPGDVARLNVVLRLMLFVALFEQGLLQAMTSQIAKAHFSADKARLAEVLGLYTFVSFVSVVGGFIILALIGRQVLAVFGPAFPQAYGMLVIVLIGRVAFAATGPSVLLLNLTGGQRYLMTVSLITIAATLVFGPLAAWLGGIEAFALVSSLIYIGWGVALAARARRETGLETTALQGWRWFRARLSRQK